MAALSRAFNAQAALADGDLVAARGAADEAITTATGWAVLMLALTTRARVAIAQGEPEQAESDAHDALASVPEGFLVWGTSDTLAVPRRRCGRQKPAATGKRCGFLARQRAIRQRMGVVRFKIYDAGFEASVAALRNAMGQEDFESAWAEGVALSTEEAIAYAQRGRGGTQTPGQRLGLTHAGRA